MKARAFSILAVVSSGLMLLMTMSCSPGSDAVRVGTPAFYWSGAKEAYAAGDYLKTIEHLENLAKTQNEFTARAMPWELILTSGMVKGYMELADNFEYGAKANLANSAAFRRQMTANRTYANTLALQFARTYQEFQKNKDPQVRLDFPFPTGSPLPSPQLTKIGSGAILSPDVIEDVRRAHLQTSVLHEACSAVGSPDDVAKSQEVFKGAQIPREVFLFAMADSLHEQAKLYVRSKLDQPNRVEFFATQSLETLKQVPESKATKALADKIQKTLKSLKST
jgi:hypothetical protein